MQIALTVNGKPVALDLDPMRRLLDVLREDLGLTGTKEGCGAGECGACTVLLNGRAVCSCLVPVGTADGAEVTTVEGLAGEDGELDPVQRAFEQAHAAQCGFCIPGMVLSTKALLMRIPDPDHEQIEEYLEGNLCRCTGYAKIVDAVKLASARGGCGGGQE